jgi:hypothetical protein
VICSTMTSVRRVSRMRWISRMSRQVPAYWYETFGKGLASAKHYRDVAVQSCLQHLAEPRAMRSTRFSKLRRHPPSVKRVARDFFHASVDARRDPSHPHPQPIGAGRKAARQSLVAESIMDVSSKHSPVITPRIRGRQGHDDCPPGAAVPGASEAAGLLHGRPPMTARIPRTLWPKSEGVSKTG